MTDLAQGQVTRPQATRSQVISGRATARAALDAALSGVELTATDRRFLARLSQWDKRTATMVASLVARAKESGQREAAMAPPQLDLDGCPWCGRSD
jgi:hypothetical protein